MNLPRLGDWQPGGASPALLAIQLVATFQAALRGLDYWRPGAANPPGALAVVESAAPPTVWAGLMFGSAVLILLGLAGRWPAVLVVAHLILAAVYVGVGVPVLSHSAVGPLSAGLVALAAGALGTWTLTNPAAPGGLPARLVAVVLLAGVVGALSQILGTDYRTGTGMVGQGVIHAALAAGVAVNTLRRTAARLVEAEEESEVIRC